MVMQGKEIQTSDVLDKVQESWFDASNESNPYPQGCTPNLVEEFCLPWRWLSLGCRVKLKWQTLLSSMKKTALALSQLHFDT